MSGIWCVGCLHINKEIFSNLWNAIALKFEKGSWGELGAGMVKYTTSLSYTSLNESNSKLYTNFEFCEEKKS